ncbi:zinc-binding dehydrogenase [Tessaracoccus antarcticus]|uniref:zinc-binding dehydrogenase n=1 Tax=Tessaracoccus antarcticus TaxID=2479848 RepID=UPI001F38A856|nr:zinc-binding dehydrogenase [Tessaracoccus antarcticus]
MQLAKHAGAFVAATARGAGVSFAGDMGADVVLDAENEELSSLGRTFDVVFDTIGGEALAASYGTLMPRGRLVTLHAPPDESLSARYQVESFFFIVSPDVGELDTLAGLAEKGLLRVTLSASYPLEEARAAFAHASSPKHAPGKTVLVVRD